MQRVLQGEVIYDKMSRRITPTFLGPISNPEAQSSLSHGAVGPTPGQKHLLKTIKTLEQKYGGQTEDQLNARLANALKKKKKTKKVRKTVPKKIKQLANKSKNKNKKQKKKSNQHKRNIRLICKCKIVKKKK